MCLGVIFCMISTEKEILFNRLETNWAMPLVLFKYDTVLNLSPREKQHKKDKS